MTEIYVDHLLNILQKPYLELAHCFDSEELAEIGNLEMSFRKACKIELAKKYNISLNLNTIQSSILIVNTKLVPVGILKNVSLVINDGKAIVYFEDMTSGLHLNTENSLKVICPYIDEIVTGERCLDILRELSLIEDLLSSDGRLKRWPRKQNRQNQVLSYLRLLFKSESKYAEKEINEIVNKIHSDHALIRRALVSGGYLLRTKNGSEYWRSS